MKVEKVYFVGRGPVPKRLRVKIDGRAYFCGNQVRDSYLRITRIESTGNVEFEDIRSKERHTVQTIGFRG